ncbi:hypothetical protein DJ564_00405 [Pseudomonas sp. 31-12]|nr:hypothetical protein DJ564_00405 [Pseudomonas sp. 31-12]
MWRGSLLPLGREAAPNPATAIFQAHRIHRFTTAAQPNGSKLPRHTNRADPAIACRAQSSAGCPPVD